MEMPKPDHDPSEPLERLPAESQADRSFPPDEDRAVLPKDDFKKGRFRFYRPIAAAVGVIVLYLMMWPYSKWSIEWMVACDLPRGTPRATVEGWVVKKGGYAVQDRANPNATIFVGGLFHNRYWFSTTSYSLSFYFSAGKLVRVEVEETVIHQEGHQ